MNSITHLSTTQTASLIRVALKTRFPGVHFSVRSRSYAGGSSIDVKWTDGPTDREVKIITDGFQGSDFDGMRDLKTSREPVRLDGGLVRFGADYVFTKREFSAALLTLAAKIYQRKYGWPINPEQPWSETEHLPAGTWWRLLSNLKTLPAGGFVLLDM